MPQRTVAQHRFAASGLHRLSQDRGLGSTVRHLKQSSSTQNLFQLARISLSFMLKCFGAKNQSITSPGELGVRGGKNKPDLPGGIVERIEPILADTQHSSACRSKSKCKTWRPTRETKAPTHGSDTRVTPDKNQNDIQGTDPKPESSTRDTRDLGVPNPCKPIRTHKARTLKSGAQTQQIAA